MKTFKSFKFRLYPNEAQARLLLRHFGCCRFIYNYFLQYRIDYYANHKQDEKKRGLNYHDTAWMLTEMKQKPEFEWLNEVNSQSLQSALHNLETAYVNFFKKRAKFPTFKKRHQDQSFRVPQHFSFDMMSGTINIPKLPGIKAVFHRKVQGRAKSITISMTPTGKFFASILCEVEQKIPKKKYKAPVIGLDLGLKSFAVTSDGEIFESPKFLRLAEKQLKRAQRKLSRTKKGSNRRAKARHRLAVKHEKVANQRKDFLHKLSRKLVGENQAIYVEDLGVKNMMSNHKLAKSIGDSGWGEFIRQLSYKGQWYGCEVKAIDRFFPSSKRCSVCGYINQSLSLKTREWDCPECETHHNRDVNAANNILKLGTAGLAETYTSVESRCCNAAL